MDPIWQEGQTKDNMVLAELEEMSLLWREASAKAQDHDTLKKLIGAKGPTGIKVDNCDLLVPASLCPVSQA